VLLFVENNDSFSWNVLERLPLPREAVRVVSAADALRSLDGITEVVVGPGPMDPGPGPRRAMLFTQSST